MGKIEINEVVMNLCIYKQFRLYDIIDPNSQKIFNRNAYRLFCIISITVLLCVFFIGHLGFFVNMEDKLNDIDIVLMGVTYIQYYLCLIKFSVLIYRADIVWDLLDVAKLDFLTSEICRKNINILYSKRDWIIKATNRYCLGQLVVAFLWILSALVINALDDNPHIHRYQNILNFRFPVPFHIFNKHYILFYIIELMLLLFIVYTAIIVDTFIMSFCWVVGNQYQLLTKSIMNIGYEDKLQSEYYEDLKSIISDQIQLSLKVRSLYFVIRPIMIIYVGLDSCTIILLTYTFIVICSSLEMHTIWNVIKLSTSISYQCLKMLLNCYLFDIINNNRESVNFGLYSCNWTTMDLKFKKLLLFTMGMNDANRVILKASPKKIIDLQLFSNVMKTCFNTISVMLKTINTKRE